LPRKTDSNNPADWLAIAEADMAAVRLLADHQTSHTVCRSKLAEVIEKLMKAELIRLGWRLIKTHNLVHLVNELDARGSDLISVVRPLASALAEAYFSDRYPGFDLDDPDWPPLRRQIEEVGKLLDMVKMRVAPKT